jgi:hypothetical protein
MTQTLSTVSADGTFTNISLASGFAQRCFDKIAARDTTDAEYDIVEMDCYFLLFIFVFMCLVYLLCCFIW